MKKNRDMLDMVLSRTCCRSFGDQQLADEDIRAVLSAGVAAPSAKNRQPWYMLVIKNKNIMDEISKAANLGRLKQFANWEEKEAKQMIEGVSSICSNDRIIVQASVAILLLRNSDPQYSEYLSVELDIKEEQSVACCAYSMMLAAQCLGIGAGWICSILYIKKELIKILAKYGTQWHPAWEPRVLLPLGYPAGNTQKPKRKKVSELSLIID